MRRLLLAWTGLLQTGDIGVAMEKVENQVEPVIIILAREDGCLDWGNSRIIIL